MTVLSEPRFRAEIDAESLPSKQLRQLSKAYTDLADLLDSLSKDPKRQLTLLGQIVAKTNGSE